MNMFKLFSLVGGTLLCLALPSPALAQEPPCYAVLSLIGDKLDVVMSIPQTGSRIERNQHTSLPVTGPAFDDAAVSAAAQAVRQVVPGAILVRLSSSSPELYNRQHDILEESGSTISLPDAIMAALRKENATHLILITKFRDDARLQLKNRSTGTGKLEGLGFYVDRITRTVPEEGGMSGVGFLAPFVYIKIALVDARTLKVINGKVVKTSSAISAGRAQDGHPWEVLTTEQKLRSIDRMVRNEIAREVPELLKTGQR
jgi:hypothetical protein